MQPDSILGLWNEIGYCIFVPSLFGIKVLNGPYTIDSKSDGLSGIPYISCDISTWYLVGYGKLPILFHHSIPVKRLDASKAKEENSSPIFNCKSNLSACFVFLSSRR